MRDLLIVLAALVVLMTVTGCNRDTRCVTSHEEPYTWYSAIYMGDAGGMPMYVYVPVQDHYTVCDRYEILP